MNPWGAVILTTCFSALVVKVAGVPQCGGELPKILDSDKLKHLFSFDGISIPEEVVDDAISEISGKPEEAVQAAHGHDRFAPFSTQFVAGAASHASYSAAPNRPMDVASSIHMYPNLQYFETSHGFTHVPVQAPNFAPTWSEHSGQASSQYGHGASSSGPHLVDEAYLDSTWGANPRQGPSVISSEVRRTGTSDRQQENVYPYANPQSGRLVFPQAGSSEPDESQRLTLSSDEQNRLNINKIKNFGFPAEDKHLLSYSEKVKIYREGRQATDFTWVRQPKQPHLLQLITQTDLPRKEVYGLFSAGEKIGMRPLFAKDKELSWHLVDSIALKRFLQESPQPEETLQVLGQIGDGTITIIEQQGGGLQGWRKPAVPRYYLHGILKPQVLKPSWWTIDHPELEQPSSNPFAPPQQK